MNPFMLAGAVLMAGASGWAFWGGNWKTGILYIAYSVANAVLATIKS
jgi:hypothetical protein